MQGSGAARRTLVRPAVLGLALALGLSGCTVSYRNHGYVPEPEALAALDPGRDTRDSVVESLGTPTSTGVLGGRSLYWIQSRFRYYGGFAPQEIDRTVVALDFDANGVLRNVERFGLEDGRVVSLTREVTDDNLRDTTFLRQLLQGIGRFDPTAVFGSDG